MPLTITSKQQAPLNNGLNFNDFECPVFEVSLYKKNVIEFNNLSYI